MLLEPIRTETLLHSLAGTSLDNVKANLRITNNDEDDLLIEYIKASTDRLEKWLGMTFLFSQNINYYNYCSSCADGFVIKLRPFVWVESIEYFNNGAYVTLDPSGYFIQEETYNTLICVPESLTVDCNVPDPIKITYVTGFKRLINQSAMVEAGGIVTVTATGHGLETGNETYIKGADQPEYNGIFNITRIDDDSFTFEIVGSPAQPTGPIIIYGQNVPELLQMAIKHMVGKMYGNRGDCCDSCGDVPCGAQSLAKSYRKIIIRTTRPIFGCQCC